MGYLWLFYEESENSIEINYNETGIFEYALYIYVDGQKILAKKYDSVNKISFDIKKDATEYKLVAFVRDEFGNAVSKSFSVKILSKNESIGLPFPDVVKEIRDNIKIKVNEGNLIITLPNLKNEMLVAYYLSNNNGILEKKWYSSNNEYKYKLADKGQYKSTIFLMDKDNNKDSFELIINY